MNGDPIVYLAGGIAGVSGATAMDWRDDATRDLDNRCVSTLDPMRAKHLLGEQTCISSDFHDYEQNGVFFRSRGIMVRDYNDVKRCDALLVNLLGAQHPSLGTIMELAWAYALQKPAVVIIEARGNPHDNHPMIHEAMSFRVETLDEGIDAVAIILGR